MPSKRNRPHAYLRGVAVVVVALVLNPAHSASESRAGTITGSISGFGKKHEEFVVFVDGVYARPKRSTGHGIGQRHMKFVPDFIIITNGDSISFPNGDAVTHNVFSFSRAKKFDLGLYNPGENKTVAFPQPGFIDVFCSIHENMHATVVVVPSSHYVVPDRRGDFVLSGVRPGKHELVVWRKGREVARKRLKVAAGKNARVSVRKSDD